uniref:Uncharacterized protein n=1 Tax=Macaca fascicularis TaxID=9541 RepID=A0A7N9D6V8_MACFA
MTPIFRRLNNAKEISALDIEFGSLSLLWHRKFIVPIIFSSHLLFFIQQKEMRKQIRANIKILECY